MTGWWLASYIALWILVFVVGIVSLVLLRQMGLIYLQSRSRGISIGEGPAVGSMLPVISARDSVTGENFTVPSFRPPGDLLVFVSPGCGICGDAIRDIDEVAEQYGINTVVISDPDEDDVGQGELEALRQAVHGPAKFMESHAQHLSLDIRSTPQAIVIDAEGFVANATIVNRAEHLRELLDRTNVHTHMHGQSGASRARPI